MKYLFICLAVLCASCSTIDSELKQAIAYGEIKELNRYSPTVDKPLFIRLFQSPVFIDGCFKETQGVCQYQYFLSVSTFDEYPETTIYPLNSRGEVNNIKWSNSPEPDTAVLHFTMSKYTREALGNNKNLSNEERNIRLVVTPQQVMESLTNTPQ